tara:strand:- start:387 stop:644 length:258 start_codon:yes stop_codon:yes gene_type:complete
MEECAEVTQRASKALRFGLNDPAGTEPGQPYTNQDRLLLEINDLLAILDMMFKSRGTYNSPMLQQDKKEKVEKYLKLSKKLGTLE